MTECAWSVGGRRCNEPTSTHPWLCAGHASDYRLLRAARIRGVSPRRLLGWEPKQITTHDYDAAGRLARSTTTVQPEWSAADLAEALDCDDYEADFCPGGDHPLSETTKPDREDAYATGLPIRCHYCTASERGSEQYRESPQSGALMLPVRRRDA